MLSPRSIMARNAFSTTFPRVQRANCSARSHTALGKALFSTSSTKTLLEVRQARWEHYKGRFKFYASVCWHLTAMYLLLVWPFFRKHPFRGASVGHQTFGPTL
jgi:hypothetical protein